MKEICKARRPVVTLLCTLLCAPILFGAVLAEAMVTLQFEDYVQFGMFDHRQESYDTYDGTETPVLWQVRSADSANPVLLTHYLVDQKQWAASADGMSTPLEGYAWTTSSDLRLFLNSTATDGFLGRFTLLERTAMGTTFAALDLGGAYVESDRITLPSLADINSNGLMGFQDNTGRIAKFKGANSDLAYWLRSAGSRKDSPFAAYVYSNGYVNGYGYYVLTELGVRPASQISLNRIIFKSGSDLSSPPSGVAGQILNPFILFLPNESKHSLPGFASADIALASAEMDGRTLTLTFGRDISPAVRSWPDLGDFTLKHGSATMQPVSVTSADSDKLVLTFADAVAAGETLSLDYNLNYDAVSFDFSTTFAGVANVMASSPDITVQNLTLSTATTPGDITVTVDGVTYYASQQPDDSSKYLILLPVDTDASVLSSLAVTVALPGGASISPGSDQNVDFSNGPVTFTITAQDGTTTEDIEIEVRIGPVEGVVVTTDETRFDVYVTYNADGTLSVEVRLPFADDFEPDTLSAISAVFSNLTDITFTYVDADDNVVPFGTARRAGDAYLRINATAESVATMNSAELSSISYSLTGDRMGYQQDFDPALKLSGMQLTYTNDPPSNNSSSGVGCSAGLGALGLIGLIAPLAAARRRRR